MKEFWKIFSVGVFFVVLVAFAAVFSLGFFIKTPSSKDDALPKTKYSKAEEYNREASLKVSKSNLPIEKYILKYNPKEDKVILITRYEDKSEIISYIDSINPSFLEEEDITNLSGGIEFTSKEALYMLIEDYSS